jgi:thioredoxin-related protein
MKTNIKLLLATCAILSVSSVAKAGGEGWSDNFEESAKLAASEGKDMLVDFTGSDWCGWCIRLNKEVFSHDEFKEGVKDGYVLVELDYPRDTSKLSAETIAQNEKLKEKYSIKGFPTILVMDGKGKPFAKTGYRPDGPVEYVKHLSELSAVREARDEAFEKAAELEGVEKAEALIAALQSMNLDDSLLGSFYAEEIEAIKVADPSDESGYVKNIETKQKFAVFQEKIKDLAMAKDLKGALALTDEVIAKNEFEGELEQQITAMKGTFHIQFGEIEKGFETLDKAEALDPESDFGKRIAMMKTQIKAQMDAAAAKKAETEEAKEEAE